MKTIKLNERHYLALGFVLFLIIVFVYIKLNYVNYSGSAEHFDNNQELNKSASNNIPVLDTVPVANPDTGTILDGPGFELGYVQGTTEDIPNTIPGNYYFLDDGANGEMSIQHNMCSKSCCSEQWPTPFKMDYDPYVCQNKDKYVPSNIFCNNAFQSSGCMCLTKDQASFLYNRGGNGNQQF
jgi:hypothetical protein